MLKPTLQLKLGQSLTMTPQLQQAIKLLQLPVMDLNQQIAEALEANVMLEMEDLPDAPKVNAANTAEVRTITAPEDSWRDVGRGQDSNFSGNDGRSMADFADDREASLREHLLTQLETENFTDGERVIGESVIDAIDDDGYLFESLEEIHDVIGEPELTLSQIERVLVKIQRFDPLGIGARSLTECISLQLAPYPESTEGLSIARRIAEDFLPLVADQNYTQLRRRLAIDDEGLEHALALIRSCHPKPGQAVNGARTEYVVPDVFVRKVDGDWIVEISPSGVPRLQVNQQYAELLRGNSGHSVLRGQLQEARWLVRSLEIRNDTLFKVANTIVERQIDFFDQGEEAMKPMILRDIADAIEMHESTVSRVTNNKYMHTPRGVFEFKYFFSSHVSTTDGDEQSSVAVRAKIRKLISAENPAKPLSDSKITTLLKDDGVQVARRTVAKYREAMNIASSSERRQRPPR
ncbi:MAG: RNA polymerase factor sigma-54 [Pseudomonadota bacterium]